MSFKDLFKSLKDKGQDIASNAKKLLPGGEEGVDDSLPPTVLPGDPLEPPPLAPPPAGPSSGTISRPAGMTSPTKPTSSAGAIVGMAPTMPPGPNDANRIAGFGKRGDSKSPIIENDVDDTFYQKKQGIVDDVDERFGRFGPRVSSYLLTQSMMPNGLKMVLSKLELRPKGFDAGDKGLIEAWLDKNGTDEFARRVGLRLRDSDSSSPLNAGPQSEKPGAPNPVRVRQLQKPKGQFDSDLPARGSSSSQPLPRPKITSPPSSQGPLTPWPSPPPGPPPPPPISAAGGPPKEEPKRSLAPEDMKPVTLGDGPEFERRASMAKSPVQADAPTKDRFPTPSRLEVAPAPPPPPPPPPAAPAMPPKLPQNILPPETEPDDAEQSKKAKDFLMSALDESSRFRRKKK